MRHIGVFAALVAAYLCLGASPALAQFGPMSPPGAPAGQQEQPAAKKADSPFALPQGQAGSTASQQKSPFALPQQGQASAPPAGGQDKSPFALPGKEPSAKTSGQDKSPFAMPQAQPPKDGAKAQQLLDQGVALAKQGKLHEAQEAFWQAVQTDPANAVAWNNLGLTLRQQGKLNQAMGAYKKAIEADRSYAVPYKNLGVLLEKAGGKTTAAKAYRKYAKLAPDAPDAATVNKRAAWLESQAKSAK